MKAMLQKVRDAYPESKRDWDSTYPVLYFLWRPLSFGVSAWLMSLGVTANQVTLATAVMAYGGLAGLAGTDPDTRVWGSLGLVLYNFFDCVDGNIARASPPERPPRGQFFDQLAGNSYFLAYLCLGLGLREEDCAWPALAWGASASVSKFVMLHVRADFWAVLGPAWGRHKESTGFSGHSGRWYYKLYYNLCDLQGHVLLLPFLLAQGWALQFLAASAVLAMAELASFTALYVSRSWQIRGSP